MHTTEQIRERFDYEPKFGILIRRETGNQLDSETIKVDMEYYPAANIAWVCHYGIWPTSMLDHINRRRKDISILNLRPATIMQNAYNTEKESTVGAKGVYLCGREGKRWQAQIRINGKKVNLGRYYTREEAAEAYRKAALEYHGEFACLTIKSC